MKCDDSIYANVRGLVRGLAVLKELNAVEDGGATPRELSNLTGPPCCSCLFRFMRRKVWEAV